MSKIYDKAFKVGFLFNILLFIFFNFLSYVKAVHEYDTRPIKFSAGGYSFGFPFSFYQAMIGYPNNFYFDKLGLGADVLVITVFSFLLGLIFKHIWAKFSKKN